LKFLRRDFLKNIFGLIGPGGIKNYVYEI